MPDENQTNPDDTQPLSPSPWSDDEEYIFLDKAGFNALVEPRDKLIFALEKKAEVHEALITKLRDQLNTTLQELTGAYEANNRQQAALDAVTEERDEILEELRAFKAPPHLYATVIKPVPENRTADIVFDGDLLRVKVAPNIPMEHLLPGTGVRITNSSKAILDIDLEAPRTGSEYKVSELLDDALVLVEGGGQEKRAVHISDALDRTQLEPGSRVFVVDNVIVRNISKTRNVQVLGAASVYALAELPETSFDDIGGLQSQVQEIQTEILDPYVHPYLYGWYPIPQAFNILEFGRPGNGKTMVAQAIAYLLWKKFRDQISPFAKSNFLHIRGPELHNMWWGNTEEKLRHIYDGAAELHRKSEAPVILFFDDCEALFLSRGASTSNTANMDVVTQFTTLTDGVQKLKGVSTIMATNRMDLMDPAILRRMNRKIRIPDPDTPEAAQDILQRHLRRIPLENKSPDTVSALAQELVARIWQSGRENNFLEIVYTDGEHEVIPFRKLLSGKILAEIVDAAMRSAKNRDKSRTQEQGPSGVSLQDLFWGLEQQLIGNDSLPRTRKTVQEWLRQGDDDRTIAYIEVLRHRAAADERRDRRISQMVQ